MDVALKLGYYGKVTYPGPSSSALKAPVPKFPGMGSAADGRVAR